MQADCKVEIVEGQPWHELRQNGVLGLSASMSFRSLLISIGCTVPALEFMRNAERGFGVHILSVAQSSYGASTDFVRRFRMVGSVQCLKLTTLSYAAREMSLMVSPNLHHAS